MKVVLFCGGPALRMRQDGAPLPKSMAMIGDRPVLWHVMRYYAHFGHTDFILCLGHGAAAVRDYFLRYEETLATDFTLRPGGRDLRLFAPDSTGWNITFVDTGPNASVGERLTRVRRHVEEESIFLATYADALTDAPLPEMIDRFRRDRAVAAMLAVPARSTQHAVDVGTGDRVTRIRPIRDLVPWRSGGHLMLRPEIFTVLRDGEDLVPDAFGRLLSAGRLTAHRYTGFWRAAASLRDRAELEEMYLSGRCPWTLWDNRGPVPPVVTSPAAAPPSAAAAPTTPAAPVPRGMPAAAVSWATGPG